MWKTCLMTASFHQEGKVVWAYKANLTLPLVIELLVPSKELFCQSGIFCLYCIKSEGVDNSTTLFPTKYI